MVERRKFLRIGSRFKANYKVVGSTDTHYSLTRNISGGGISLYTDSDMRPGALLEIQLMLSDERPAVKFTGQVIWSGALLLSDGDKSPRGFEAGVKFVEISPEDREAILQGGIPP